MLQIKRHYNILLVIVLLGLFALFLFFYTQRQDGGKFIDQVKKANEFGFDSLQLAIDQENEMYLQIEKSINDSDFNTAYILIDSLKYEKKHAVALVYEGMIYEKQSSYHQAIEKYNAAIENDPYSIGLSKRADVYVKMKQLDSALKDYREVYSINYDFSLQIARIFELKGNKDSALKYYHIYSRHYPQDSSVQRKINALIRQ